MREGEEAGEWLATGGERWCNGMANRGALGGRPRGRLRLALASTAGGGFGGFTLTGLTALRET